MLIKNIVIVSVLLVSSGCANTDSLEQKVSHLSTIVNELSTEVSALKAQQANTKTAIAELKQLSETTNDRVNNMVATYKK